MFSLGIKSLDVQELGRGHARLTNFSDNQIPLV